MQEESLGRREADRTIEKEASVDNQNAPKPASTREGKKARDVWDFIELFLRPTSAFLTAITVALIGWFGQQALIAQQTEETKRMEKAQVAKTIRAKEAQKAETERNEMIQNYRLYSELLSRREDAESALRRNMFTTILEKFFQVNNSEEHETDMDQRLLKLEMLSLNFGESLSLSPLFISLDHAIDRFPYAPEFSDVSKIDDRNRLHSLAKRVADQQVSALSTGGIIWEIMIPLDNFENDQNDPKSYWWPEDDTDYDPDDEKINDRTLENITRTYAFNFSEPDHNYKSVHVLMRITTQNESGEIEREFDLNYFNFPMVDNTRLSKDQRFALILTDFADTHFTVTAIIFPGKYSGQRDKPFLDDVIHRLQDKTLIKTKNVTGRKK